MEIGPAGLKRVTVHFEDTVRQAALSLKEPHDLESSDEELKHGNDDYSSEDEWDTDLETPSKDEQRTHRTADLTGKSSYLRTCRALGVPPVSVVLDTIHTSEIALPHHGLGPKGGRALARALVKSTTVAKLDLQENSLGEEGVDYFAKMFFENCYITWVNLSGNSIGSNGARAMGSVLKENQALQWLDLSFNNFVDKDARPLAEGLKSSTTLQFLNLSRNSFCEAGGELLGLALEENNSITELNLSWNHLRLRGAIAICKVMAKNSAIKILDLSWNGFADDGAEAMGNALKKNDALLELDLSHNRISEKGAFGLAKGLEISRRLRVLKIGFNPFGNPGAYAFLKAIEGNPNSALDEIHLDNITLKENFEILLTELMKNKPALQVTYAVSIHDRKRGSEAGYHDDQGNDTGGRMKHELLTALKTFLSERRLRALDLFNCLDKDKTQSVSPNEMFIGLKKLSVPLSDLQLKRLIRVLDKDGDGEIDYGEFAAVNEK